jgi:hypothetical protein
MTYRAKAARRKGNVIGKIELGTILYKKPGKDGSSGRNNGRARKAARE